MTKEEKILQSILDRVEKNIYENNRLLEVVRTLERTMEERDQAVELLKEVTNKYGDCTGCIHNISPFCSYKEKEAECGKEENYWEWRGIFEEEETEE